MADVVTISSKGQVVIPHNTREEMGIHTQDKFILVHDKDSILLKRLKEDETKLKMLKMLDKFADEFKKHGIKKSDIEKEIRAVRAQ